MQDVWVYPADEGLWRVLSTQEEEGLYIPEDVRRAASDSAEQALRILVDMLGEQTVCVDEGILMFAATHGWLKLIQILIHQGGREIHVTDKVLEAAFRNSDRHRGEDITRFLIERRTVKRNSVESNRNRPRRTRAKDGG